MEGSVGGIEPERRGEHVTRKKETESDFSSRELPEGKSKILERGRERKLEVEDVTPGRCLAAEKVCNSKDRGEKLSVHSIYGYALFNGGKKRIKRRGRTLF